MTAERDAVLLLLAHSGWANKSEGFEYEKLGFFARLSNGPDEIHEIKTAFHPDIERIKLTDTTELIGHFLVRSAVDVQQVSEFNYEVGLIAAYEQLVARRKAQS